MTKLIPLRTIEHGVRRAIDLLGESGVVEALDKLGIRRSASLIRKCADPDDDRHHLQLRYAIALDIGCKVNGHLPPLLEVHQYLVEEGALSPSKLKTVDQSDIVRAVLVLQAALGDLAHLVNSALEADSELGEELSERERHEIFEAIEGVEHRAEKLKRLVSQ